ncbi:MAG TPA: molybdenum cofactor biosynthesis protein MoaE [Candidatus Thermoplasmatota archaeon]|nr:molybdenum cofactor biosynthesis protein MoaE [Candidatus Thermoplasmatota archaeon]
MSRVTVRLFAAPREAVGAREVTVEVAPGARVADLLDAVVNRHPALAPWRPHLLVSVNRAFALPTSPVAAGDEVALMPPVSGGSGLHEGPFDTDAVVRRLAAAGGGAVVTFTGVVRPTSGDRPGGSVVRLEFESYEAMAEEALADVASRARAKFGVLDAVAYHRVGVLAVGEPIVLVAAAAAHRREAFEAAQWMMEEIKSVVPIWKREIAPGGDARWVRDPVGGGP